MKIAVFSYHCFGNDSAEAIVSRKAIISLLQQGFQITLFTWRVSVDPAEEYDNEQLKIIACSQCSFPLQEKFTHIVDSWIKTHYLEWPPKYIYKSLALFLKEHSTNPFDCIYSRSHPISSHIAALGAKRASRLPWIANFDDPYPLGLYPKTYSLISKGSFSQRLQESTIVNDVFSLPDRIVFPSDRLGHFMKEKVRSLKYRTPQSIATIEHIGAGNYPCKTKLTTEKQDTFTVAHIGKIDLARAMSFKNVLLAWKLFCQIYIGKAQLRIIGTVDESIRAQIEELQVDEVVKYLPPVSYPESISEIDRSDLLLLVEAPMEEGIFLPSKFCDYISRKKPVLCISPKTGVISDLIQKYGGGIVISGDDIEAIKGAFIQLSDTSFREKHEPNAELMDKFSTKTIGNKLKNIFLTLKPQ